MDADVFRIPVGPGALHVERYGHGGAPIVLLHGFGTCSFLWRTVAPQLAEARLTAYAIDLLGHGESDRPFDADFGIDAQAEYLERALTALRVARAAVVGVDLGGNVALRLASERPDRVARLVLIGTLAFDALPGEDIRQLQRNVARFAFRLTRGMFGASPLLTPLLEGSVADPRFMPPRLVGRYLAPFVGEEGVNHLLALARSIRGEDLEDVDLADVRAPTIVACGTSDQWMPADVPEKLAKAITNCRLVQMPGVGRLIPEEAPDELAQLLADFVNPQVRPPQPVEPGAG
jgi:pimeloyl-ACP methyl ester carboxylesterase